jgi:hypothetical protein
VVPCFYLCSASRTDGPSGVWTARMVREVWGSSRVDCVPEHEVFDRLKHLVFV